MDFESPIKKMEVAYRIFTEVLTNEVQEFWKDNPTVGRNDTFIDADSLRAIMIYIVIKAKWVKMLVDIIVWENFTSEAIKYTNRAYYMTVLHTAFEFLETLTQDKIDEFVEEMKHDKVDIELYQQEKFDRTFATSLISESLCSSTSDHSDQVRIFTKTWYFCFMSKPIIKCL